MKNSNYPECKYLEQGMYCVHKDNNDVKHSPSENNPKLRRKRCIKRFCPLK